MFLKLIGWLVKSRVIKIGGGFTIGGGVVAAILGFYTNIENKIEKQDVRQKEYVQLVVEPLRTEIKNMKENVDNTNTKVNSIYKHLIERK